MITKKPFILFLSLFLMLALWGCKEKELPEEIIGEPTFYIEGDIDNQEINLQAGVDEYYMATEFFQDEFQVYSFSGTLSPIDCPQCPESMQIQIRDFRMRDIGVPVAIDSAIEVGEYGYYHDKGGNDFVFRVSFHNESTSGNNTIHNWNFGDGNTAHDMNPIHAYEDTGSYQVSLLVTDSNGCQDSISQMVEIVPDYIFFIPNTFSPNGDGINDDLAISFDLINVLSARPLRLQLYDLAGRQIYAVEQPAAAGRQVLRWAGRDAAGSHVPPGLYLAEVHISGDAGDRSVRRTVSVAY